MNIARHAEAGFALAVVLWLVALLSMMALSLGAMQRTETAAAANQLEGARARAAAQAGMQLAILDLMRAPGARALSLDGAVHETRFGDALLYISAVDEAGKVDLNFAPGPLLDELLQAAGVEEESERLPLVDAILDWRDTDELRRIHGAEREEYQADGRGYAPRNAPFQSIEELSLVRGMSAPLYQRLATSITIFTGASTINQASVALNRLPMKSALEDEQDLPLAQTAGDSGAAMNAASGIAESGRVVTLHCDAQLPNGVAESLQAVVRFTPRRGSVAVRHEVLVWRERPAGAGESSGAAAD